jgi:hypothetical protein
MIASSRTNVELDCANVCEIAINAVDQSNLRAFAADPRDPERFCPDSRAKSFGITVDASAASEPALMP